VSELEQQAERARRQLSALVEGARREGNEALASLLQADHSEFIHDDEALELAKVGIVQAGRSHQVREYIGVVLGEMHDATGGRPSPRAFVLAIVVALVRVAERPSGWERHIPPASFPADGSRDLHDLVPFGYGLYLSEFVRLAETFGDAFDIAREVVARLPREVVSSLVLPATAITLPTLRPARIDGLARRVRADLRKLAPVLAQAQLPPPDEERRRLLGLMVAWRAESRRQDTAEQEGES
jgi:hypothetical protein